MSNSVPVLRINDSDFRKQVVDSLSPTVVIFERKYWGAAHIMIKIIEKIAIEYRNRVNFFRYDLDENNVAAGYYRIINTITILVFVKGEVVSKTGFTSEQELRRIIDRYLENTIIQ